MTDKPYLDLSWADGWDKKYRDTDGIPPIVAEAREKGYKFREETIAMCHHRYYCDELKFYFDVDSSD